MKVLGFAGSNSAKSINKQLVAHVTERHFADHDVEILDLNDFEVPIFSLQAEEANGIPKLILDFAEKISSADLIITSLAENNGSYNAGFKNIYDWTSRIADRKVFDNKAMLLMATSPGGRGGVSVLEAALDRFPRDGAKVKGSFSLPSFYDNLGEGAKELSDAMLRKKLDDTVAEVKASR